MRRLVSIVFLSLLLLQAIPVLHFFSSEKAVFYALVDEEKPGDNSVVEKKTPDAKEFLAFFESQPLSGVVQHHFPLFIALSYPSPSLDALTPPPNA